MQAVQSLLPKNKSAVQVVGLVVEHNTEIQNVEQGIDTSNRPLTSCKFFFFCPYNESNLDTMKHLKGTNDCVLPNILRSLANALKYCL